MEMKQNKQTSKLESKQAWRMAREPCAWAPGTLASALGRFWDLTWLVEWLGWLVCCLSCFWVGLLALPMLPAPWKCVQGLTNFRVVCVQLVHIDRVHVNPKKLTNKQINKAKTNRSLTSRRLVCLRSWSVCWLVGLLVGWWFVVSLVVVYLFVCWLVVGL